MNQQQSPLSLVLQNLLQVAIDAARKTLIEHGSFSPCALRLNVNDTYDISIASGVEPQQETPSLLAIARQEAESGKMKAMALYRQIELTVPGEDRATDAIQVMLEEANGGSFNAFQPFSKSEDGGYEFGRIVLQPAANQVFSQVVDAPNSKKRWWQVWK